MNFNLNKYAEQLENALNAVVAWQGIQGLNLYCRSQSAVCYRYTNSLYFVPCRHSSRSGEESELLLTGVAYAIKEKGCLSNKNPVSKPSLIICYQRRKVNSFLVQILYIHRLSCRAPPTVSALLIAPAHAVRFHTNRGTVQKLRRFSQVLPLNT